MKSESCEKPPDNPPPQGPPGGPLLEGPGGPIPTTPMKSESYTSKTLYPRALQEGTSWKALEASFRRSA
eukprot:NODE_6432_length_629_cov_3.015517_g5483_i0.p5 GENE.NODE_6432_length_629_cov_3.015517_g5483_i0~~NODE_6432_length_629_cov_3.015517_g5483_i0.p5  ORF type:complete len:69 (-),score=13.72 NODE_6432_length_629_cov_3.015517_g5483_i0:182-388(-)